MRQKLPSIHWLTGLGSIPAKDIITSPMASVRLRAGCLATLKKSYSGKISFGSAASGADILVVGKPASSHSFNEWLTTIEASRRAGCRIVLDYTDNHLGFYSALRPFYERVLELVDVAIVPSGHMSILLSEFFKGKIVVIEDAVECIFREPSFIDINVTTGLWFGHESNIEYLHDFLNSGSVNLSQCNITIVSSYDGWKKFQSMELRAGRVRQVNFKKWTLHAVEEAALECHFALIPSDLNSPRKNGASSNRLLVSLALGLPAAADILPSYREFKDYFIDIRGDEVSSLIQNPNDDRFQQMVLKWQNIYRDRFTRKELGRKWIEELQKISETGRLM